MMSPKGPSFSFIIQKAADLKRFIILHDLTKRTFITKVKDDMLETFLSRVLSNFSFLTEVEKVSYESKTLTYDQFYFIDEKSCFSKL